MIGVESFCTFWIVTSLCRSGISVGWLLSCYIIRTSWECWATEDRTCSLSGRSFLSPLSPVSSMWTSRIELIVCWPVTDTNIARGSGDRSIGADLAHLTVPIELVEFRLGLCAGLDNSQRDPRSCSSCCYCWGMSLSLVSIVAVMFSAPMRGIYFAITQGVRTLIPGGAFSEYGVVKFYTPSICGIFCPVEVPVAVSIRLLTKVSGEADDVYLSG